MWTILYVEQNTYFYLSLWAIDLGIYSQTKLSGTITDIENKPIIGANIVLPELQKETVSDSNGNYVLTSVPKGSYKVVFLNVKTI